MKHPDPVDAAVARFQADGRPGDDAAVALFTRLALVTAAVRERKAAAVDGLGVPMRVVETLYALRRRGRPYEAGPTDLARELGVSQAAMTARVRALADDGHVVTRADADDGRRVVVRLTAQGHRLTERVFAVTAGVEEELLAGLTPVQRRTLDRLVRTVFAASQSPSTRRAFPA